MPSIRQSLSRLILSIVLLAPNLALALPDAAAVAAYAEKLLNDRGIAADGAGLALLVARGDQLLHRTARGSASIELGVPLKPEHRFRIGSVTKQYASATLLQLVDAGRARLDDTLSKFLPAYPGGAAITLAQLLNHSSGIKSYTGLPGYMHNPIRRDLSTAQLIDEFKHQPPDFAPGQGWAYNNSGYVLVGAVIEAISGKPWHRQLDEALLRPNGLTHTLYPGEQGLVPGMAQGYDHVPDGKWQTHGVFSMTQPHAAGALVSDLDELWRWNRLLHGGKLLSVDSYRRMTTPEGTAGQGGRSYGYGLIADRLRGQTWLLHGGGIHGFSAWLSYAPASQVSVALLRNSVGPGPDLALMARKLSAFAAGQAFAEPVPATLSSDQLAAFEGVYRLESSSATRELRVLNGRLHSTRAGSRTLPLHALAGDRFGYDGSLSSLQAERGADGAVVALLLFNNGEEPAERWLRGGDLPAVSAMALDEVQQQALVGDWAGGPVRLRVFQDGARLMLQVQGQPAFEMLARTPRSLFIVAPAVQLEFEPADGQAQQMTLLQGPVRLVLKRI